ncbi:hypothetical protein HDU76_008503 [Blyttiomyces sp. JEL0837]|nr:hypothetical protein HDU76_008503 [Blyttiomyces sp. JEL0837]
MGTIASAVSEQGGTVRGVIPQAMTTIEGIAMVGETTFVKSMHERKALMSELSDAFIALPGGYGTFEELLEMTTWSQLSIHAKPIGVLNINGFYDPLIQQIDLGIQEGFIRPQNRDLIVFKSDVVELLDALENFKLPPGRYEIPWSVSP